jgi:hypothetical protein
VPFRVRTLSHDTRYFLLAALLYTIFTGVLSYPVSVHPASVTLGSDIDVQLFTWTLAWDAHALIYQPLRIFDANIFYPFANTLAFSENLLGSTIVAAPILWATRDPVLAMNAVSLSSCVLCGLGAYVLARRIGLSTAAAFLCGAIFAFSPARFFRFQQIFLTTVQWIPFSLAFLFSYFRTRRRADLRWAVGFFSLQAVTSGHGAVFLILAASIVVVVELVARTRVNPRRVLVDATQTVRDFGVAGLLLLIPAAWIVSPYLTAQRELDELIRAIGNWRPASVNFLASPTHVHRWILAHLTSARINERANAFLFPGYIPLFLAMVALLPIRTEHRRAIVSFALVVAIAIWFCLGPPLGIWPLVYSWPGLNFIRVPSRFAIMGVLGLAVLAGIAFDQLATRFWPANRTAALVITTFLLLVECADVPLPVSPYAVRWSGIDRWLNRLPKPFVVAEVPVGLSLRWQTNYMLHSMAHWQRTVHGYSGIIPALHEHLYEFMRGFPDAESVKVLRSLGVNYIVVHVDGYQPGQWPEVQRRLADFASTLQLVHAEKDGRVYALR